MIRLFAALAVPPEIGEGLRRHQEGLLDAKWRPLDAFHITLRFMGEVAEPVAEDLDIELAAIAGEALTLELAGVGAFGEGQAIDSIWAGVTMTPALKQPGQALREGAARRAGLKPDRRAWKPHVTLAYLSRPDPARVGAWIQAHNLLKSPPFRVERFGLYSSWRGGAGGAGYRLEAEYSAGGNPASSAQFAAAASERKHMLCIRSCRPLASRSASGATRPSPRPRTPSRCG